MELVTILRDLWRLRLAVLVVALISVFVGYAIAYDFTVPPSPRSYTVGVADARILVDTPNSQVVEVAPKGSETLGARANVLANLMIDGTIKDEIAQRAGLRPDQLVTGSLANGGAEATYKLDRGSYALTTGVVLNSDQAALPIISVHAQGPDARRAIALADASVAGLDAYLNARAENEQIETSRRLQVTGLGPAQGHEASRGQGRIVALLGTMLVFVIGCAAILIGSATARGWRTAAEFDEMTSLQTGAAGISDAGSVGDIAESDEDPAYSRDEYEHSAFEVRS